MYVLWILLSHVCHIALTKSLYVRTPFSLEDLHKRTFFDKLSALYHRNKVIGNVKQAPFERILPSWATMYNKLKEEKNHPVPLSERKENVQNRYISSAYRLSYDRYPNTEFSYYPYVSPTPRSFFYNYLSNPNTFRNYMYSTASPNEVYWTQKNNLPNPLSIATWGRPRNNLKQSPIIYVKRTSILKTLPNNFPRDLLNCTKFHRKICSVNKSFKSKNKNESLVKRIKSHIKNAHSVIPFKPIVGSLLKKKSTYFTEPKGSRQQDERQLNFLRNSTVSQPFMFYKTFGGKRDKQKIDKLNQRTHLTFNDVSYIGKKNIGFNQVNNLSKKRYSSKKTVVPHVSQLQSLKKHHIFRATDFPLQTFGEWEYRKFRIYHEMPTDKILNEAVNEMPYNFADDEDKTDNADLIMDTNEVSDMQESIGEGTDSNKKESKKKVIKIPILNIVTHADDISEEIHPKKFLGKERFKEEDSVRKSVLTSEASLLPEGITTESASKREMSEEELEALREDQRANSLIKSSEEHKADEPEVLGMGQDGLNPIDKSLVTSRMSNAPIEGLTLNTFHEGIETNPQKQININDNFEPQKETQTNSMYQPFDNSQKSMIHPSKEIDSYEEDKYTRNYETTREPSYPLQQGERMRSMLDDYERHTEDVGSKSPIEKFSNEPPLEMTLRPGETSNLEETINQLQSGDPDSQKLVNQFTAMKPSMDRPAETFDNGASNNVNTNVGGSPTENGDYSNDKQKEVFDDVLDPEKAQERALHFSTQAEINKKLNHDVLDPQAPGLIANSEDGFQEKPEVLTPPAGLNELPYKNREVGETVARQEVKPDTYSARNSLGHSETYAPHKILEHTEEYSPRNSLEHSEPYLPQNSPEHMEAYSPRNSLGHIEKYSSRNTLRNTDTYIPHNFPGHTETYLAHSGKVQQDVTPTRVLPEIQSKSLSSFSKMENFEKPKVYQRPSFPPSLQKESNVFTTPNLVDADHEPKSETMSPEDALNALNNINLTPHHAIRNAKATRSSTDEVRNGHSQNDSSTFLKLAGPKGFVHDSPLIVNTPMPIIEVPKTTPTIKTTKQIPSESTATNILPIPEKHKNESLKNNSLSEIENAKVTKEVLSILESLGQLKPSNPNLKENINANNTLSNQSQIISSVATPQEALNKTISVTNDKITVTQEDAEEKETKEAVHDLSIAIGILERKLALIKAAKVSGSQNSTILNILNVKGTTKSVVPSIDVNSRSHIPRPSRRACSKVMSAKRRIKRKYEKQKCRNL